MDQRRSCRIKESDDVMAASNLADEKPAARLSYHEWEEEEEPEKTEAP